MEGTIPDSLRFPRGIVEVALRTRTVHTIQIFESDGVQSLFLCGGVNLRMEEQELEQNQRARIRTSKEQEMNASHDNPSSFSSPTQPEHMSAALRPLSSRFQ